MANAIQWYGSPPKILWPGSLNPNKIAWHEDCCCGGCTQHYYEYEGRAEMYFDYEMNGATSHAGAVTDDGNGFIIADEGIDGVGRWNVFYDGPNDSVAGILYQSNLSPLQNDTWAKYKGSPPAAPPEANFSGYSSDNGGWPVPSAGLDANDWQTTLSNQEWSFTHNGGGTDNANIYGLALWRIDRNAVEGVVVGDWTAGGLTPASDSFPMDCLNDNVEANVTYALSRESSTTTGQMVVTDIAERSFHQFMPGHFRGQLNVRLWSDPAGGPQHNPATTDTLATYTALEPVISGYSGLAMASQAWRSGIASTEATVANKSESSNDNTVRHTHNGGANSATVNGCWLYRSATGFPAGLVGALRFATPVTLQTNGDYLDLPFKDFLWNANQ